MLNQTSVTEFLLLGVTDIQVLQPVLFVIFLATYIVNVAGNAAILMVVISDPRLHSPMYFFLGSLCDLVEIIRSMEFSRTEYWSG